MLIVGQLQKYVLRFNETAEEGGTRQPLGTAQLFHSAPGHQIVTKYQGVTGSRFSTRKGELRWGHAGDANCLGTPPRKSGSGFRAATISATMPMLWLAARCSIPIWPRPQALPDCTVESCRIAST